MSQDIPWRIEHLVEQLDLVINHFIELGKKKAHQHQLDHFGWYIGHIEEAQKLILKNYKPPTLEELGIIRRTFTYTGTEMVEDDEVVE